MTRRQRSSLAGGLILILLGALFLAQQTMPHFQTWLAGQPTSALLMLVLGGLFLLFSIILGLPGMAVPACILGGIGGLLYWQSTAGNPAIWTYGWALIPGFVGVGLLLMGLLGGRRHAYSGGAWLIFFSVALFAVLASVFARIDVFSRYWPFILIGLGIILLLRSFFRK
jgi:hypothetical protein